MIYKTSYSQKFRNIHREAPLLESLFYKVADLQTFNFIKKRLQPSCFPFIVKIWRNTYFEEHLRTAASELTSRSNCLELCFLHSRFQNHPVSVTLQKYKSLSNQSFNTVLKSLFNTI